MTTLRLDPIDQPPTLLARIAALMMRRELGKVMTPARVLYNRVPRMYNVSWQLVKLQRDGLVLEQDLRLLVQTWVAMINRCAFCIDISKAQAVQRRLPLDKFHALPDWRTSPLFSDRERAALAYADEATRHKQVDDATFDELRQHFSEREIVEITFLNALENFYNLMNLPLGIEEDGLCALAEERQREG
ncbi:carboxymuconolactone decarboxylase family protein [Myxococcota bacterium]|nr:carboxymuconolactone decarboxylase family protein [Myxococcota bacterium]MCZ7617719.1 carboxymuconolactone decarboxylase family protein [Myxococcota bacterium]